MSCRFCLAAVDAETAAEWCRHDEGNPSFVSLATALARFIQGKAPTDEQIGWVVDDAQAIFEDMSPATKWTIRKVRSQKNDGIMDEIIGRFSVNGVTFVWRESESADPPVRLSELRQWQREADGDW